MLTRWIVTQTRTLSKSLNSLKIDWLTFCLITVTSIIDLTFLQNSLQGIEYQKPFQPFQILLCSWGLSLHIVLRNFFFLNTLFDSKILISEIGEKILRWREKEWPSEEVGKCWGEAAALQGRLARLWRPLCCHCWMHWGSSCCLSCSFSTCI